MFSFLWKPLAAIGGLLAAAFALIKFGQSNQKKKEQIEDLKDYKKTRKDIDDAIKDAPPNYSDARDFLLSRRKRDK